MRKIVIDTNFLMIPYKFRVDIFSEFNRICSFNYKLFIFEQSINELRMIIEKHSNASERITRSQLSGKEKKAAQFALELIKLKNIGIIKSEQWHGSERVRVTCESERKRTLAHSFTKLTRSHVTVDSLILKNLSRDTIIATQDIDLKKELLKKGYSVIILRQKRYLQLIERKFYK